MKTFSQLTVSELKTLKDTGLLWEIYPEAKDLFAKPGVSINKYHCWVCKKTKDGEPAYISHAVNGTFQYCSACWNKVSDTFKDKYQVEKTLEDGWHIYKTPTSKCEYSLINPDGKVVASGAYTTCLQEYSYLHPQTSGVKPENEQYYKPMPEAEKGFLSTGQNFCKPKNELETCCQNGSFNDGHECAKQPAYNSLLVENIINRYVNHYEYWQPKVHVREVLKQAVEEVLKGVKALPYSPPTAQAEPPTDSKWKKSALELGEIVKCFNTNRCYEPALKRLAECGDAPKA